MSTNIALNAYMSHFCDSKLSGPSDKRSGKSQLDERLTVYSCDVFGIVSRPPFPCREACQKAGYSTVAGFGDSAFLFRKLLAMRAFPLFAPKSMDVK